MSDKGYLQHGTAPGPFRTEEVTVRNLYADNWEAYYESKWRMVHITEKRTYIKVHGVKINIQIEGV